MKRQTSRSRKERAKKGLVGLLTVSMCLSTLQGISFADSRTEVGGVEVNGRKITLSLSGTALRTAAETAFADATLYDDQYIGVSKDERTQAAYEALTDGSNPLYELTLFSDGEIAALEQAGVEVKALIQMDQEQAEANGNLEIATESDITKQDKEDTQVVFSDPDKENEKELVLYRPGSLFGNFYDQFSNKLMHNADETEITPADPTTYELNGEEKVTFLFINHADESRVFNIDLNGKTLEKGIKVLKAESAIKGVMGTLDITGIPETTTETKAEESTEAAPTIADANATVPESIDPAAGTTDATDADNQASDTTDENAGTSDSTDAGAAETTAPQTDETAEPQETLPQEGPQEAVTESAGESTSLTEAVQETLQQVMETIADATETLGSSIQETVEAVEETLGVIKSEASENSIASDSDIEAPETETEAEKAEAEENAEASTTETTTETETVKTDMDLELENERKDLLRDTHAADLVDDSVASAKVLQYTLDDLSKSYWSAEIEGRYEVSVFAEDNAFAEPVQLELKELEKPAEAEDGTLETSADTLTEQQVNALKAEGAYENSQSIDISFVNADGDEVEPASQVKVRIKVYKEALPEDADVSTMQIKHLSEKTETISVDTVAEYSKDTASDTGKIQAVDADGKVTELTEAPVSETAEDTEETAEDTAQDAAEDTAENAEPSEVKEILSDEAVGIESTFTVDSFSTFSITWGNWWNSNSATVYYVQEGNLTYRNTLMSGIRFSDISNGSIDLCQYAKERWEGQSNYPYPYADLFKEVILRRNRQDYPIKQRLTKESDGKWHFTYTESNQTGTLNDSDQIYVVYGLKEVETVDNRKLGFHLYMTDHVNRSKASAVIGNDTYISSVRQGLYSKTIGKDGFPTAITTNKSIKQLFFSETNTNVAYKTEEVTNLLLKSSYDNTGYFYYNSTENFASLSQSEDGVRKFKVYEQLGTPYNADAFYYKRGNFMPYNTLNLATINNYNLFKEDGSALKRNDSRWGEALYGFHEESNDYNFGLYGTAEFYQPVGGKVNGKDMVYEFTGDDDMVVYIDGVLVLDLGGIHDAQSGSINFATGAVTDSVGNTTIKAQFDKAQKTTITDWKENTFADGTLHKIQIFYMERGEGASNLKLKVNIPPIPDGSVTIKKQVEGLNQVQAENETYWLQVLTKSDTGQDFTPLANCQYSLLAKKGQEGDTGRTDENGYLQIKAGDVEKVTFSGLKANTTFKVVESTPSNYQVRYDASPEKVKAQNYNGDGIAVTVPAAGNALVTVTNTPTETGTLTINHEFLIDGALKDAAPNPDTFKNAKFTLWEVGADGKEAVNLGTIPYASFESKTYTFELLDKTKNYRVVADISDATNGGTTATPYQGTSYRIGSTEKVAGKEVNNISLLDSNKTVTFTHVYETPKVDVTFTKVDAEDTKATLANAVFALYTDPDATKPYTTKDNSNVTAPANENGVVTFTGLPYDSVSGKTYYIKEITAPTGYVLSDAIYTAQITPDKNGPRVSITGNGTITKENVTKIQNTPVKLTFYKKANDSNHTSLKGAKIKIEKKVNNTYQPVTNLTSEDDGKFTIPESGLIFNKIPDGEYRITEVTAPAGYNLLTKSFEFSISNGRLVQPAKSSDEQVTIVSTQDGAIDITIFNTPGRVLPGTGGMGTFLYNLSGLALMLTALVYIIHARHRQKGGLN